jgi:hypothetical protein
MLYAIAQGNGLQRYEKLKNKPSFELEASIPTAYSRKEIGYLTSSGNRLHTILEQKKVPAKNRDLISNSNLTYSRINLRVTTFSDVRTSTK